MTIKGIKNRMLEFFLKYLTIKKIGIYYKYNVYSKSACESIELQNGVIFKEFLNQEAKNNFIVNSSDFMNYANSTFVRKYRNASILPETDAVVVADCLMSDRFIFDNNAIVSIGEPVVAYDKRKVIIKVYDIIKLYGTYINLCYDGAKNIWHLTFDMLSKFAIINNLEALQDIPIVMDERIKSFDFAQQYIRVLNKNNREIIYASPNILYRAEAVIDVSPAYYFYRGSTRQYDIFCVNVNFIPYFKKNIRDNMIDLGIKKFYIERGDDRMENENEIKKFLITRGFKSIRPEKLSFYQELGLFTFADCIIGSIGAAFTNIIYCEKNANIICIGPKERMGLAGAYEKICQFNGANFYYISAMMTDDLDAGTPGMKFKGKIDELRILLNKI